MSEDLSLIDPSLIRVEPPTQIVSAEQGQYLPPFSSENPFDRHLITVGGFEPGSSNMQALNESINLFKFDIRRNPENARYFEPEQLDSITNRLQEYKKSLQSDRSVASEAEQITISHEESHRAHEVRFNLQSLTPTMEDLKRHQYEITHEVRGTTSFFSRLDQSLVLYSIYSEAEATVSGLRNARASESARVNQLEWRAAISFSSAFADDAGDVKSLCNNMYHSIQGGFGGSTFAHLMADLIIAFDDPALPLKIQSGEMSVDVFSEQAPVRMRELLLHPEIALAQIDDPSFGLAVDHNLIESVQKYKENLQFLQQKNEERLEQEDEF